ncbi:Aste57867_3654 [Aphanomyces stellatus]|uniref:Aste57867_3654 protein n=1 Tax=Aphanomyces stellatus TaxID=120398 RepID=A0A485KBS8_9STRA|nr:hypothetical protein As57867_003643 [Aphanomyces stellatus]VFT80809.1 Aste57867_3654 [Aphanomyces stellatus]
MAVVTSPQPGSHSPYSRVSSGSPGSDLHVGGRRRSSIPSRPATNDTATSGPYVASHVDQIVDIRPMAIDPKAMDALPPTSLTLLDVFKRTVNRYGYQKAIHAKHNDSWHALTWRQYYTRAQDFMKALVHIGVLSHDVVAITGFNSIEYNVAYMGTIMAGATVTGIYVNSPRDLCHFIASHAEARVIVCDSVAHVETFLSIQSALPLLKAIVLWGDSLPSTFPSTLPVYNWRHFLQRGHTITRGTVARRMDAIQAGQCAAIVYSSGTTGVPKGVMISHDNFCFNAWSVHHTFDRDATTRLSNRDVLISYLPLAHVTAQFMDIILPLYVGYEIHFAPRDALRGTLGKTLKEIRPTRFCGVPGVWDKMATKLREVQHTTKGLKKQLVAFATSRAWKKTVQSQYGQSGGRPCGIAIAEKLVLSRVKAALGLDRYVWQQLFLLLRWQHNMLTMLLRVSRCKTFSVTAAPIRAETIEYYGGLDMPILEFFGASETSGVATMSLLAGWKLGSVGRALPGTEVRVQKGTHQLLLRGRHVMMGYLKNESETQLVIDTDGWLHSGDVATVDGDGFCAITGSLRDMVTTANGQVIVPATLETILRQSMPELLSHVVVIGQQREFLVALFTLRCVFDGDDRPTDALDPAAIAFLHTLRSRATTVTDAKLCPKLRVFLDNTLRDVNKVTSKHSFSNFIQKVVVLPQDLSVAGGELTPTLKVRRHAIEQTYHELIETTYGV